MANKISKSNQHLSKEDIAEIFNYREKSLKLFFSNLNPNFTSDFVGYTFTEIIEELNVQLSEAEKDACLNLLASLEAKFRLDYIIRCEEKHKEDISRTFRKLFAEKRHRISLEDGILEEWKKVSETSIRSIISTVKGAFKYRHWLAHGRYWTYKSTSYDFYGLYNLALQVDMLPLKS